MMLHWNGRKGRYGKAPHVDAFIEDLIGVYQKHKLSLGHEDTHGAFIVEEFEEKRVDWLRSAHDETKERRREP